MSPTITEDDEQETSFNGSKPHAAQQLGGTPSKPSNERKLSIVSANFSRKLSGGGAFIDLGLEDAQSAAIRRGDYALHEDRRILKNLVVLGVSFTLLFSSYMATANLQSSINAEGDLGTYALASLYTTTVLASLTLPPFVLYKLKAKPTLVLCIVGYVTYISSQFYPVFATMIPACIFVGVCGANLWASVSAYLAKIAEEYAIMKKESVDAVLQRFFGIFFLFFHSAQIWGNLVSSAVLSGSSDSDNTEMQKATMAIPDLGLCGANFCPAEPNEAINGTGPNIERPDDTKIYILFGIFLAFTVGSGITILVFVDSLARYGEQNDTTGKPQGTMSLLIATIKHWKKPTQLFIIPATIWLGIQEAFIGADFTKAFVACAWGLDRIGFVMMCFGICASISSVIIGKVMEWIGRPALFIMAGLFNFACLFTMLLWPPTPDEPYIFFIISGLWGIADGVWSPQIKALYGAIFPDTAEPAFSNAVLWTSIGFIIVYSLAGRICMYVKLYLYIGFLGVSMICYILVEILDKLQRKRTLNL